MNMYITIRLAFAILNVLLSFILLSVHPVLMGSMTRVVKSGSAALPLL